MIVTNYHLVTLVNLQKIKIITALSALILLLASTYAQAKWRDTELNWKLKRDRNGVQIYLSKVPGSKFRAVLSVMEIEATTTELAALVMDLDNCPNWASMCRSARIIERISALETYVHSVNNAPFPVRNRDMVARVMRSDATPERLAKKKGLVRVQHASAEWYFIPVGNGKVRVENFAHVDPNGKVPAWLTNLLIVESPYKTLINMRKLVSKGGYRDAKVAFIPQFDSHNNSELIIDKMPEKVAELEVR